MIISLEGISNSIKERFTEHLVRNKPEYIGRVICCPEVYPRFNEQAFKGWMYTVTRSTELWREATVNKDSGIIVFENSPFSIPSYVKALSEPYGEVGEDEYSLIVEIIEGLSELMIPPDIIVLFEPKPSVVESLPEALVRRTQDCLHTWANAHSAQVVNIPAYEDDSTWETWYNDALKLIIETVEALR